jgi:hypothetical protein
MIWVWPPQTLFLEQLMEPDKLNAYQWNRENWKYHLKKWWWFSNNIRILNLYTDIDTSIEWNVSLSFWKYGNDSCSPIKLSLVQMLLHTALEFIQDGVVKWEQRVRNHEPFRCWCQWVFNYFNGPKWKSC